MVKKERFTVKRTSAASAPAGAAIQMPSRLTIIAPETNIVQPLWELSGLQFAELPILLRRKIRVGQSAAPVRDHCQAALNLAKIAMRRRKNAAKIDWNQPKASVKK